MSVHGSRYTGCRGMSQLPMPNCSDQSDSMYSAHLAPLSRQPGGPINDSIATYLSLGKDTYPRSVLCKVHEVMQMLEDAEDDDIESVDITIQPQNGGADSDSDDEMVAKGDPNSLSRNKLLAEACVQVQWRHGGTSTYCLDLQDDEIYAEDEEAQSPAPQSY